MKTLLLALLVLSCAPCVLRAECDLCIGRVGPGNCVLILFPDRQRGVVSPVCVDAGSKNNEKAEEFLDYLSK